MTTAKGYNVAVEDLAAAGRRVRELETESSQRAMAIKYAREALEQADTRVAKLEVALDRLRNHCFDLEARVRVLGVRNAKLEAVREAAKAYMYEVDEWMAVDEVGLVQECPVCDWNKKEGHYEKCERVALEKALAASEPPQDA